MDPLPACVRLIAAPGGLRDAELEVFGWRTEHGETMVRCRLVDGSMGTIPARWTDLPRVGAEAEPLGVIVSPEGGAGWGASRGVAGAVSESARNLR